MLHGSLVPWLWLLAPLAPESYPTQVATVALAVVLALLLCYWVASGIEFYNGLLSAFGTLAHLAPHIQNGRKPPL